MMRAMDITDPTVERYAEEHSTAVPSHLEALAAETRETMAAWGMMVGHLEGRFLEMLVYLSGARRVLEIGMFTGYSSLSMAAGLPPEGRIITCDVDPKAEEVARGHIARIQAAQDGARPQIDAAVPHPPRDFIALFAGREQRPADLLA